MKKSYVIDTSVLIAVLANEQQKAHLIQLTTGGRLFAPPSVHWEVGNAFSAMLKRQRITAPAAQHALEMYASIPIRFVDIQLADALRLCAQHNLYAYDAYVLQCALTLNLPLISLDQSLLTVARQLNIQTAEVSP